MSGLGFTAGGEFIIGLKRWDEGRWGKGNGPQYSRIYNRDPLTHLALSHLLSPLSLLYRLNHREWSSGVHFTYGENHKDNHQASTFRVMVQLQIQIAEVGGIYRL